MIGLLALLMRIFSAPRPTDHILLLSPNYGKLSTQLSAKPTATISISALIHTLRIVDSGRSTTSFTTRN